MICFDLAANLDIVQNRWSGVLYVKVVLKNLENTCVGVCFFQKKPFVFLSVVKVLAYKLQELAKNVD